MIVKVKTIEDRVVLYDEKGNLLKSFEIKENLPRALEFLKQLNSIKTIEGAPVYKTKIFEGISIWSFYQATVFMNFLKNYVQYEEIVKFLIDNKIKEAIIDGQKEGLEKYLKINEIKVINDSSGTWRIRSFFVSLLMKTIALIITFLALFKVLLFRPAILVYTPDKFSKKYGCDFRFYAIYDHLKEKKLDFIEIFHTRLDREFLKNIITRKRLAFYLEVLPLFSIKKGDERDYDLSIFEAHNQKYFQYILKTIDQGLVNNIRRIKILARLLKLTKIKTLLSADDVRYANELIVACRLNKIKTYGFQHGHFSKYHVGWINYGIPRELSVAFDKLFVWNDYWKKVLFSYSTQYCEANVAIGGLLRELQPINFKKRESKIEKISDLAILVPYEPLAVKKEIGYFLNRFIGLGIKIFFKIRPDAPVNQQLSQYHLKSEGKVELVTDINEDVLSKVDAVAGAYSTFLNEMIFYEKPVFVLKNSFDFGHRLVEDNLGMLIKEDFNPSSLLDYVNNYQSKKNQAWPLTKTNLRQTLNTYGIN